MATAFAIVKYAGGAYLVALGVLMLWKAGGFARVDPAARTAGGDAGPRLLFHAAMTGILNPKVAVFFLAFLPQFVQPARGHVLLQFLLLGLILSVLGFVFDAALAVASGRTRARFASSAGFTAWRERVTGAVLMGLGLRLAIPDRR